MDSSSSSRRSSYSRSPSPPNSPTAGSMAFWNPEIAQLQAKYKLATDRVLNWLKNQYKAEDATVNFCVGLAERAARDGIPMPDDILLDLRNAIQWRQEAAEFFEKNLCASEEKTRTHRHMIDALQKIERFATGSEEPRPLPAVSRRWSPSRQETTPSPSPMELPSWRSGPRPHLQQNWRSLERQPQNGVSETSLPFRDLGHTRPRSAPSSLENNWRQR